jgi:NAD(P)-dependent dehydrogenase (short-subunit alcohol dehydrogenase family)
MKNNKKKFALITGAAGLLGREHSIAILEENFNVILTDINLNLLKSLKKSLIKKFKNKIIIKKMDVSNELSIKKVSDYIKENRIHLDVLINNAAIDAKVGNKKKKDINNLENLDYKSFIKELNVGLIGALIAIKYFGTMISKNTNGGSIINIGSDLSVIAPNQSLYQNGYKKPASYSMIKHGLLGLTKYVSTYWPKQKVRCNMLSPGPVLQDQPKALIKNLKKNIPLGRLASKSEYKSAIKFLINEESSYITGQNIIIDGGRTVW